MPTKKRTIFNSKAPITIIGVIIIGLIISALYDLLVKPGLSTAGRFFLDIFTLGSQTIKDSAYSSAALDPRPVSVLLLVIPLLALFYLPVALPIFKKITDFFNSKKKDEEVNDKNNYLNKTAIIFLIILYITGVTTAFSVHNQSIIIWRTFHSNLSIITPYVDAQKRDILKSKFSSMEGRSDYKVIDEELKGISKKEGVKLKDINLW